MARKKKGLPFVVQPRLKPIVERIGSEESGILEIERRGYLSVAEKAMVDQAAGEMGDQAEMIEVVRKIARLENRSITDIFQELQDADTGSDLLNKYAVEVAAVSSSASIQQQKTRIVASTALIISRIDPEWGVEETMELHPDLLDGLYELFLDEDARSLEAFENSSKESKENASKKPQASES